MYVMTSPDIVDTDIIKNEAICLKMNGLNISSLALT